MNEYVGTCSRCGVSIYCSNGFLEGVIQEDGTLLCLECREDGGE
ncbi:hypothetical protein [Paludifilum halophilum]|nr:hypothetical protein [Paludifilum halophilum]